MKHLNTQINKLTNQNSQKLLFQPIRICYYKTLGTSVINRPLSPLSLSLCILLLGCCTRFSYTLIKRCTQLAKLTFHPLYPITSPPSGGMNWPINVVHISWLNWWQIFPCNNIHVYSISIIISSEANLYSAQCMSIRLSVLLHLKRLMVCCNSYFSHCIINNFPRI